MLDFIELTPCQVCMYCIDAFLKVDRGISFTPMTLVKNLREIISRWGLPSKLTLDNGTHFVNSVIQNISEFAD